MPYGIYQRTEEHKKNLGKALKGIHKGKHFSPSTEFKKGSIPWSTGKHWKMSEEQKKQISQTLKGRMPKNIDTLKFTWLGKKRPNLHSEAYKQRLKAELKGEGSPLWKGGVTPINKLIRCSAEYRLWREAVFVRDNFTCVWCGVKGSKLNADHIKPFAYYPELRFAIDNGRTLCIDCHKKTDTYAGKAGV